MRALTPHVGAYLETCDGGRLGVRRARPVEVGVKAGAVKAEWGAMLLGCGRGALRLEVGAARRRQADGRRRLPARPLAAEAVSGQRSGGAISPSRRLAFEVVRATFEQDAHTERAFREAADAAPADFAFTSPYAPVKAKSALTGLGGRERAQAQRLAYGTVQRRATLDAALERLVDRPLRKLDPPVLAALRLGAFELLFADATPDHAAVDQAVELAKAAGAAHAAGLVNAVLRRARPRARAAARGAAR